MTKDLFAVAFTELSRLDRTAYDQEYVERLPFLIARTAAQSFPDIAKVKGFSELRDFLEAESAKHWTNPELYTHLLLLHNRTRSVRHRQVHILRTHVGLIPPDAQSFFNSRFLRIKWPRPHVFELRNRETRRIDGLVLGEKNGGAGPLVYRPYANLFDDIAGGIYAGGNVKVDVKQLGRLAKEAIAELHRYCPQLAASFCQTMGTIAFTAGSLENSARSYSAELSYLGGMFTLIVADNLPALVENLIHEYYHSRLWAWWLIEKPRDLPPRQVTIVSPITKSERPAVVMMQALLIYAGLADYYRFVIQNSRFYRPKVLKHARSRLKNFERNIPKLVDSLNTVLRDRPQSRRFTAFVSEFAIAK